MAPHGCVRRLIGAQARGVLKRKRRGSRAEGRIGCAAMQVIENERPAATARRHIALRIEGCDRIAWAVGIDPIDTVRGRRPCLKQRLATCGFRLALVASADT